MAIEARTANRRPFASGAKVVVIGATVGFTSGALVGGVGGRVAMLVLRLTSDPSVRGLETDDGFTIGVVTLSTIFLVGLTAVLGSITGVIYVVIRTWLPMGRRAALFGALTGLVGGAAVIRPGGVDFTLLQPLWLAIAMFMALPAMHGVAVASMTERWLRTTSASATDMWLAPLALAILPFVLVGPRGLPLAVLIVAVVLAARPGSRSASFLSSRPVVWLGRAVLAGVGVVATASLIGQVAEIL